MSQPLRVASIGLGLLGSAAARRLLGGGGIVTGYDVDPAARDRAAADGVHTEPTLAAAVSGAEVVLLSLPTSKESGLVVAELLPLLSAGTPIIDTTTGAPEDVERIAQLASAAGIGYFDCTVCGSSRQLERGEALLLVGGGNDLPAGVRQVVEALAGEWRAVGPVGGAARMKLVVNLVLGLQRAVLAEGLAFADAVGCDPEITLEVLKSSPAAARVMETKGARMLAGDFAPEARLRQHLKDVDLILAESKREGLGLPLSELHRRILSECVQAGWGDLDNSAVFRWFTGLNQ